MSSDLPVYAYLMRLCLMTHVSSLKAVGGNVREETNGKGLYLDYRTLNMNLIPSQMTTF